jgi:hypothetical protein
MFGFSKKSWRDSWPHHHSPYARIALIVVAVHLLLFVFAPPFHFKPYQLEAQEIMVVQEIPDFELPKPVPKEPEPPAVVVPTRDPIGDDPDVPPTAFRDFGDLPLPPKAPSTAPKFYPFDTPPVLKQLVMPDYP